MDGQEEAAPLKASKHRPTRLAVEERRKRTAKLMIRGLTPSQILKALQTDFEGITAKTVENDITVINRQLKQAVTELDVDSEVGKMLATYVELEREAWKGLHSARQPKERISGIKALSDVLSARAKLLERAGLLVPVRRVLQDTPDTYLEQVRQLRAMRGLDQQSEDEDIVPLQHGGSLLD